MQTYQASYTNTNDLYISNIEWLKQCGNNARLFANVLTAYKGSQGFYARLYNYVNELDNLAFCDLIEVLEKQNFEQELDVILWLEEG